MPTVTFSTPGAGTWVTPSGAYNLSVECIGGGGAGGAAYPYRASGAGGGGGGGAFSQIYIANPSGTYSYYVGANGHPVINTDGQSGEATWFKANDATGCVAAGGQGGAAGTASAGGSRGNGGNASAGYGTVKYNGGSGYQGTFNGVGGGGGEGASNGGAGYSATSRLGATASTGANGGNGGLEHQAGSSGAAPGGGGGGAGHSQSGGSVNGGGAGDGQIILTWSEGLTAQSTSTFTHSISGTASIGILASATLSLSLALSAGASQTNYASAGLSFAPSQSVSANAPVLHQGMRSFMGGKIGGLSASQGKANANLSLTPSLSADASVGNRASAGLSFSQSISAAAEKSDILLGFRSVIGTKLGGLSTSTGAAIPVTASGGVTFYPKIFASDRAFGARSLMGTRLGGLNSPSGIGCRAALSYGMSIAAYSGPTHEVRAGGETLTLLWDPNPESDLVGYRIYVSSDAGATWSLYADVGNVTEYDVGMPVGSYYFAITAYDGTEESARSSPLGLDFGGLSYRQSISTTADVQYRSDVSATLTFSHALDGALSQGHSVSGSLSYAPAISANAVASEIIANGDVSFSHALSSEASDLSVTEGAADLVYTSALSAAAIVPETSTGDLSFSCSLSATAVKGCVASADLSYSHSISSAISQGENASAQLALTCAVTATATESVTASVSLTYQAGVRATNLPFSAVWASGANHLLTEDVDAPV